MPLSRNISRQHHNISGISESLIFLEPLDLPQLRFRRRIDIEEVEIIVAPCRGSSGPGTFVATGVCVGTSVPRAPRHRELTRKYGKGMYFPIYRFGIVSPCTTERVSDVDQWLAMGSPSDQAVDQPRD
jgi:hypothetical protein